MNVRCEKCGTEQPWDAAARFCSDCGGPLKPPATGFQMPPTQLAQSSQGAPTIIPTPPPGQAPGPSGFPAPPPGQAPGPSGFPTPPGGPPLPVPPPTDFLQQIVAQSQGAPAPPSRAPLVAAALGALVLLAAVFFAPRLVGRDSPGASPSPSASASSTAVSLAGTPAPSVTPTPPVSSPALSPLPPSTSPPPPSPSSQPSREPSPEPTTSPEPPASPSPEPTASARPSPARPPASAAYDAAFRRIVRSCDQVSAQTTATSKSIWNHYPVDRAQQDYQQQNMRFRSLLGEARGLNPPPERAARHQRLLKVLDLAVLRTAQLQEAAGVEFRDGAPAARPYWNLQLGTLKRYEQARKQL